MDDNKEIRLEALHKRDDTLGVIADNKSPKSEFTLAEAIARWPEVAPVAESLLKQMEAMNNGAIFQNGRVSYNIKPRFSNAYIDLETEDNGFLLVDINYKGEWYVLRLVRAQIGASPITQTSAEPTNVPQQ